MTVPEPTDSDEAPEEAIEGFIPPGERDWPLVWMRPFLTAVQQMNDVTAACHLAKISRKQAYRHRSANPAFAAAWIEAVEMARELSERTLYQWAHTGVSTRVIRTKEVRNDNGEMVVVERTVTEKPERSLGALIFWLTNRHPDRWKNTQRVEQTGADGGPVLIDVPKEEVDPAVERFTAAVVRLADARAARDGARGGASDEQAQPG